MTPDDVARELLTVTPPPPATSDPEMLLAAFAAVHAGREKVIDAARRGAISGTCSPDLAAAVRERDEAWRRALEAARDSLGAVRGLTSKLGAYIAGSTDL